MRLAVLSSPESWYLRDLRRAGGSRCEIVALPFSRLSAGLGGATMTIAAGDVSLLDFDAVLVRTMPPGSLEQVVFRMDALSRLEAAGCVVLNPPRALEAAIDKYLALARLEAVGLPVPETWVGQNADEALVEFARLGGDVVVKPLFGGEGRGILRVSDEALALRAFKTLEQLDAVLYLQRFVPHEGFDLRLLVLGEQVLSMRRVSGGDWRTNISQGGRGERLEADAELVRMARLAAQTLGAPMAGVDIVADRRGNRYVLEVNAVPGWKALARTLDVDVASLVLDFVQSAVQSAVHSADRSRNA
ncbi:MAG: RimK family alpha-L-glutamate ligase [Pirellulaceae bacterium]